MEHSFLDVSWPLAACLAAGRTEADLLSLAERVERGEMGSLDDWLRAEERWQQSGINDEDLVYLSGARWPFDAQIGERGFPFAVAANLVVASKRSQHAFERFWTLFQILPQGPARTWCAGAALDSLIGRSDRPSVPADQLRTLIGKVDNSYPIEMLLEHIRLPESLDEAWIDFLDWLGRNEKLNTPFMYGNLRSTRTLGTAVARVYVAHPERTGLLPVLARLVAAGSHVALARTESLPTNHRLDSDNLKAAALFVHTVIGRWSPADAPRLAREWLEQFSLMPHFEWLQIRTFQQMRALHGNRAEALLLALYDSLITARSENLVHIIGAMNELMRERKSRLNVRRHRNELKLPAFP